MLGRTFPYQGRGAWLRPDAVVLRVPALGTLTNAVRALCPRAHRSTSPVVPVATSRGAGVQ
jgi:hypothetical protein